MKIISISLSKTGKRQNNEDAVLEYPLQNLYMVCDGVGGASKGEIASNTVCNSFETFFKEQEPGFYATEESVNSAILSAEQKLLTHVAENPECEGMATTLTMFRLQDNGALVAHAGDSRVYQVRDGSIIFKTRDHSFVNELVVTGYITEEEAKTHPKKNMITRAVSASEKHTKPDVSLLTNIAQGDFFLLCSDGVLESVDDDFIGLHFKLPVNNDEESLEKKIQEISGMIDHNCHLNSNDNYSAVIIAVAEPPTSAIVIDMPGITESNLITGILSDAAGSSITNTVSPAGQHRVTENNSATDVFNSKAQTGKKKWLWLLLLAVLAAGVVWLFMPGLQKSKKERNGIVVPQKRTETRSNRESEEQRTPVTGGNRLPNPQNTSSQDAGGTGSTNRNQGNPDKPSINNQGPASSRSRDVGAELSKIGAQLVDLKTKLATAKNKADSSKISIQIVKLEKEKQILQNK